MPDLFQSRHLSQVNMKVERFAPIGLGFMSYLGLDSGVHHWVTYQEVL